MGSMTGNITRRLREAETYCGPLSDVSHLFSEAADAIAELSEALNAALEAGSYEAPEYWQKIKATLRKYVRDSDGTATAAANGDLPVHQDCQARAESIAQKDHPHD
jgi:hypothetical protein